MSSFSVFARTDTHTRGQMLLEQYCFTCMQVILTVTTMWSNNSYS